MHLAHIRVRAFRNLQAIDVQFGSGICVLFGENAQGKTNLLEAVYLLSNLQSFRTHRVRDLVAWDVRSGRVEGTVEGRNGAARLEVFLEGGSRQALVDGRPPESTSAYLSEFHTVLFSPLDLDIARGNPELRRRTLDRATFLSDPSHLSRLRSYQRALRQRNALLRSGTGDLSVWDDALVRVGAEVRRARKVTLESLGPVVRALHREISGDREDLELDYREHRAGGQGDSEEDLREALYRTRERDRKLGYTGIGPHRDSVRAALSGFDLERHGSQGQMRTFALSLKLGLLVWGGEVLGEKPSFLLDDPGSELDARRLEYLGDFLARWPGQVFIAGTDPEGVPIPGGAARRTYRVTSGEVVDVGT